MDEEKKVFGRCEICESQEMIHKCFQLYEEVKYGVRVNLKICDDCCYNYFLGDNSLIESGCSGDCEYPEIPVQHMRKELEKFSEENGLKTSKNYDHCYITPCNTVMFGITDLFNRFLNEGLEEDEIRGVNERYIGEKNILIKNKADITAYPKKDILIKAFKKLKECEKAYTLDFSTYKEDFLYLRGSFLWAMIAPQEDINSVLDNEKRYLESSIHNARKFFKSEVMNEMNFDFSNMSGDDFEIFCKKMLDEIGDFSKIEKIGGTSGDDTIDLMAIEKRQSIEGQNEFEWLVQCKNWDKNLDKNTFTKIIGGCADKDIDGLIIITTSDLVSSVKKKIYENMEGNKNNYDFRIKYYNEEKIIDNILESDKLYRDYVKYRIIKD